MQKWQYLFLDGDQGDRGVFCVRSVNGQELPNWQKGPSFYAYMEQLGEQGWELIAAPYSGGYSTYAMHPRWILKRPIASDSSAGSRS